MIRESSFHAFVLKKEAKFEPDLFLEILEKDWGEKLVSADNEEGTKEEEKEGTDARIYSYKDGIRLLY